jgi:hypothetical protein
MEERTSRMIDQRRYDGRGYEMPRDGWTCFHCGETFTTWGAARDHFGATPGDKAACLINWAMSAVL